MKKLFFAILLSAFILVGCQTATSDQTKNYDQFAQCLTDKGMVFYGAFWCSHCADQKKMFGEAMQYINHVECDPRGENSQSQLCLDQEIEAYPTWKSSDGRSWAGAQSFETLGEISGCVAPQAATE